MAVPAGRWRKMHGIDGIDGIDGKHGNYETGETAPAMVVGYIIPILLIIPIGGRKTSDRWETSESCR